MRPTPPPASNPYVLFGIGLLAVVALVACCMVLAN